jgi:hypothetical protein
MHVQVHSAYRVELYLPGGSFAVASYYALNTDGLRYVGPVTCKRCGTVFCDDYAAESGGARQYCSKSCRNRANPSTRRSRRRRQGRRRGQGTCKAHCASKGKVRYDSEEGAREGARELRGKRGDELRPYECNGCGGWHLTSMAPMTALSRSPVPALND